MLSKLYQNPAVAIRRSFTKFWTTYCRALEQSFAEATIFRWLNCTRSVFSNCLFGAALLQSAFLLRLCALAMKRDAAQASLPTEGDNEAARQSKHLSPLKRFGAFGWWISHPMDLDMALHQCVSTCLLMELWMI